MDVRVDRVGVPGVQDKVSAAMLNCRSLRLAHSVLLKLNPREFKHLVENEHFFLGPHRRPAFPRPTRQLVHDADGEPGLVVAGSTE